VDYIAFITSSSIPETGNKAVSKQILTVYGETSLQLRRGTFDRIPTRQGHTSHESIAVTTTTVHADLSVSIISCGFAPITGSERASTHGDTSTIISRGTYYVTGSD
jgi:hypothetical protein